MGVRGQVLMSLSIEVGEPSPFSSLLTLDAADEGAADEEPVLLLPLLLLALL